VNLDFSLSPAPCGGDDEVCPLYAAADPFLGTCDPGLVCAANPNFHTTRPSMSCGTVCQIPGRAPAATGGLATSASRSPPDPA
jgi:hypothetical protein